MSRIDSKSLIVLDTHAWIWLINGDEQLRLSAALPLIERAAQFSNIKVSAISVWEVSMLEAKGRISFSMECLDWVKQALAAPGISLVPLTPEIAVLYRFRFEISHSREGEAPAEPLSNSSAGASLSQSTMETSSLNQY